MSSPIKAFDCVNFITQNNTRYSSFLFNLSKNVTIVAFSAIVLAAGAYMSTCEASSIFVRGSNYTCEAFCRDDCIEFRRIIVGSQQDEGIFSYIFSNCLRTCLREHC